MPITQLQNISHISKQKQRRKRRRNRVIAITCLLVSIPNWVQPKDQESKPRNWIEDRTAQEHYTTSTHLIHLKVHLSFSLSRTLLVFSHQVYTEMFGFCVFLFYFSSPVHWDLLSQGPLHSSWQVGSIQSSIINSVYCMQCNANYVLHPILMIL